MIKLSAQFLLGISAWEIISVDWRIDFAIRSKQGGRDNTPVRKVFVLDFLE